MNVKSITASWVIALCLLGIFSLMRQPTPNQVEDTVITIPQDAAPKTEEQMGELEATVWCALDGHQLVEVDYQGKKQTLTGAMAIAPTWSGESLDEQEQQRLTPCIQQRMEQLAARLDPNNQSTPALVYLFTQL